jgi:hypothetical protein
MQVHFAQNTRGYRKGAIIAPVAPAFLCAAMDGQLDFDVGRVQPMAVNVGLIVSL